MSNEKGFIHTRTLIALLITLSILPIIVNAYKIVGNFKFNYDYATNEMTLMDLRRVLLLAYDLKINEHELNFIYHNENYVLRLVNEKLILQPGTQIYLDHLNEINFYVDNECLYLRYITTEGKEYVKNIAKAKGIYLADFLSDDDQYDDDDFSDS